VPVTDVWFLVALRNWTFIGHAELQDTSEECYLLGLNAPQIPHVAHFCADVVSVDIIVAFCNRYLKLNGQCTKNFPFLLRCMSNNI
jgi:hypothetical protein